MSFLCGTSYVFHLWNLSSSSYPNDFVCVHVCACVHTCMSRSLFWLCLILCFVTGHVPQSGETAHKRVCDFLLCVSVKKWQQKQSQSLCAIENAKLCEYQILVSAESPRTLLACGFEFQLQCAFLFKVTTVFQPLPSTLKGDPKQTSIAGPISGNS